MAHRIYPATIISVYDGDTVRADIDLGFGVFLQNQKLRLARINAPEVKGDSIEAGKVSRDALRKKILEKPVELHTYATGRKRKEDKKGKWGRVLVDIYYEGVCMNDWLMEEGLAKAYEP